jgi:hypothetical protein
MVSRHFTPTGTSKMHRIIIESLIFTVRHCGTVPKNYGFSNFGNHPYRLCINFYVSFYAQLVLDVVATKLLIH